MSFPIGSLFLLGLFGMGAAVVRALVVLSKAKQTKDFTTAAKALFFPELNDSSVIVFHFSCVVGFTFVAIAVAAERVEWKNFILHSKPAQGEFRIEQTNITTNNNGIVVLGGLTFSQSHDEKYSVSMTPVQRKAAARKAALARWAKKKKKA